MRIRRVSRAAALVIAATMFLPLLSPAANAAIVPKRGIMWGSSRIGTLESRIGRKFALDHQYTPTWNAPFPTPHDRLSTRQGRTIIRNWKPWRNGAPVRWARIASGAEDRIIKARADALAKWGKRYYLVFHHEMDIHPQWGTPAEYRHAFQRIHWIFRKRGATNVGFVFVTTSGAYRNGLARRYYPGNRYVDVVGVDGYDWKGCAGWADQSRTFFDLFAAANRFARYHRKPLFVVEYAADEIGWDLDHKSDWIRRAGEMAKRLGRLRAMIWFNSGDQGCNWPVTSSSPALVAYRLLGQRDFFRARAPAAR